MRRRRRIRWSEWIKMIHNKAKGKKEIFFMISFQYSYCLITVLNSIHNRCWGRDNSLKSHYFNCPRVPYCFWRMGCFNNGGMLKGFHVCWNRKFHSDEGEKYLSKHYLPMQVSCLSKNFFLNLLYGMEGVHSD